MRNNLIWKSLRILKNSFTQSNTLAQNNMFYQMTIINDASYSYMRGYNGYYNTTNTYLHGTNVTDRFLTTDPGFQVGPLGNYYIPTTCVLTNAGSTTADQLGLYFYTTHTNQVPQTNSGVDIGYHYVALGTNGLPLATYGDGIPNYLKFPSGVFVTIQCPTNGATVY